MIFELQHGAAQEGDASRANQGGKGRGRPSGSPPTAARPVSRGGTTAKGSRPNRIAAGRDEASRQRARVAWLGEPERGSRTTGEDAQGVAGGGAGGRHPARLGLLRLVKCLEKPEAGCVPRQGEGDPLYNIEVDGNHC